MDVKANREWQPACAPPRACRRACHRNQAVDPGQFEPTRAERHPALMNEAILENVAVVAGLSAYAWCVLRASCLDCCGSAKKKRPEQLGKHAVQNRGRRIIVDCQSRMRGR